jgi:hypothetical protein
LAFTYVIKGQKDMGGCKMIYGTWDGAGVVAGTITFAGTQGQVYNLIDCVAVSSTSLTTATAVKMTATGTLALTFVSADAGYWSVTVA